ncbi:MAG: ABC transporter ATP-binding protein/permease [Firmicutes bacterium]|nr:ABC transporter ATP-binding protein/permease [Bacillota bacterium]
MIKTFQLFTKIDWLMTGVLCLFVAAQVFAALEIPYYMGAIVYRYNTRQDVWENAGFMMLYSLISIICLIAMTLIASRIGAHVSKTLRSEIFNKVQSFAPQELGEFSTASLITRTTNDVAQVGMAVQMSLRFLIQMPIMAALATVRILTANLQLSIVVAIAIAILLMLVGTMVVIIIPKFSVLQKLTDKVNAAARENLTGLRVVRAYNAQKFQEDKFEKQNKKLTKVHLFVDRINALADPIINLIMHGATLGIFWFGAYLINADVTNSLDSSDLVLFMGLAAQMLMAFLLMIMALIFVPRGMVSAKRIFQVLDKPLKMQEGDGADSAAKGEVEFKNVSFKYPDAEEFILHDISFKIEKGQTVGFIGSTGSGKSTLIKLVPRFYDVSEGQVLIDGVDVRKYKKSELYKKLGYVPQKGVLFSGTIKSNIAFGEFDNSLDDNHLMQAASVACASEFIEKREHRYDSEISQGGKNVSGGQKQRLSIARAIAKNPPIYIFDDSFSALDNKTDKTLRQNLKEHTIDTTSLIVASRIGTIINADKIIVLDKGKIVGEGTHEKLLESCTVYQQIASSQLDKEGNDVA